jgi:cytidyltransferase-like protein
MGQDSKPIEVLTIGTFDGLHAGHVEFLENCAKLGQLTVGINSDSFVEAYKGKKPVFNGEQRRKALRGLSSVHNTVPNWDNGATLIKQHKPDVLAIGLDWLPPKDYFSQIDMTPEELFYLDILLAYVPPLRIEGLSSSELRKRILEG